MPVTEDGEDVKPAVMLEAVHESKVETQHDSLVDQLAEPSLYKPVETLPLEPLYSKEPLNLPDPQEDRGFLLYRHEEVEPPIRSALLYDYDREDDQDAVRNFIRSAEYQAGTDHGLDLDFELASTPFVEPEAELRAAASAVPQSAIYDPDNPNCPKRRFVSSGQTPPPIALLRAQKQQMKRALGIREGNNFKGQYAHKTSLARVSIAKEGPLNKLARYYMQGGHHAKAQGQVLEALANLYDIMLRRPNHELILRLGGYSPVVGHLIYATLMHNPNTLLG